MAKITLPANELIAEDYRKHHVSLLRFTASERKEVLAELKKMQKAALAKLAESDLTEFRRTKIEALLRQINPIIEDTYKALASRDMTELAEIEEAFARKTVGPLLPSAVGKYNALTKRQIQNICSDALIEGAPSSEWWKRQSEQFKQFFSDTVRQGMMEGQGISEIARKIRSDKRAQQRAELLVRSSVMEVANKTREESFRANDDVVKGFQHVSTFDSRTTVICAARDGLTWDLDGNPIGHDKVFRRPPLHFGCRSTLVPVLRSWRETGLPFDEIPESTRASMDGQVPAKMNMDDWLKTKDDSFGEELLGKTRYHLWKDGKITLSQLTDQAGRELTVEELREKYGVNVDPAKTFIAKIPSAQERAWAEEVFQDAPEEVRRAIGSLPVQPKYIETKGGSSAALDGSNMMITTGGDREHYRHALYHEIGHVVDSQYRVSGVSSPARASEAFLSCDSSTSLFRAIEKDRALYASSDGIGLLKEEARVLWHSGVVTGSFSNDILCSLMEGKVSEIWGHSADYYKKTGCANTEIFASLFALKAIRADKAYSSIKSLLPSTVSVFEEFLKGFLK